MSGIALPYFRSEASDMPTCSVPECRSRSTYGRQPFTGVWFYLCASHAQEFEAGEALRVGFGMPRHAVPTTRAQAMEFSV